MQPADADDLIERNRALLALAEQSRRRSREMAARAQELRGPSLYDGQGKALAVSPRHVRRLQTEAAELLASVRSLLTVPRSKDVDQPR